jgi:HPt (histidine-containing phosphotransfer) domain-containing protein
LGNERLARDIVVRFRDRIEDDVARLQGALRRHDTADLVAVAHRLKGAAASLSADRLTEAARGIEEAARAGHLEQVSHWLNQFMTEGKALSRYVAGSRGRALTGK